MIFVFSRTTKNMFAHFNLGLKKTISPILLLFEEREKKGESKIREKSRTVNYII